ncbi:2-dehydro-3-deoxyphosphogluconate aldolase/(4S)-4-hydroxy-2-oxoglutarate aldolase [Streptomyces sp. LBL]|uniref:bifunctional 4-hydroxy-2-oxoglutarate aldolase/2-dehydro-3-deoxy-phosphogluconate aldolase n=1 Tax=Streptomyces sp. LBL TaxID=2940562 RepID=UPI0024732105|nr:bifunctional 4-hydroxy-2-oxoglutarate aldolase/2-dehydro-3-deoxy-phosphogluconate aldolase [Streptomyces sp. LBL]MDH6628692.1 2-dehydro-3-deoxyphosphogluconate aldolase/(4S)-4-hydroxy-2-oxoglutarate aldolase [Streptomyces sp. LBL]
MPASVPSSPPSSTPASASGSVSESGSGSGSGSLLDLAPVIPVVVVEDAADAVPLARALVAGGLPAIEVTLRTPAALDAARAIVAEVPDAVVGVGTVITPAQVTEAVAAGARFLVSPGWTDVLLDAMRESGVPFLPGVSTTSEVVALLERGVREMKFFPAEAAGGTAYLKALAGPLPQARFCPTGGVGPGNAPEYLALPNVGCVGGTWMLPQDAIEARDWARVEALAREAAGLRDGSRTQV